MENQKKPKIITDKIVRTSLPIALIDFQEKVLQGWKIIQKDAINLVGVIYTINIFKEESPPVDIASAGIVIKDSVVQESNGGIVIDVPQKVRKPRQGKGVAE